MPSDGCGADLSFGGSYGWGNDGWGSDPHPGQTIIAEAMARQAQWIRERLNELAHQKHPQKPTDDQTKKAVGDCTRELFAVTMNDFQPSSPGRNGSFDGRAIDRPAENSQVSVVNEVRAFNVSQLTALYARFVGPSRGVRGLCYLRCIYLYCHADLGVRQLSETHYECRYARWPGGGKRNGRLC